VGKTGNHAGALRRGIKRAASNLLAPLILGPAFFRAAPRALLSPEARADTGRILVIAYPPGLGDTLAATPFLSALKVAFPAAQVSVQAAGPMAEILGRHPGVSEVIDYEDGWVLRDAIKKTYPEKSAGERRKFLDLLREKKFGIVFDLLGNFQSASLTARTRAPLRAGHSSGTGAFLTHPARDLRFTEAARPMADYHLDLLRVLGVEPADHPPSIGIRPEDEAFAEECCRSRGLPDALIALSPDAPKPQNRWDAEKFARAADEIVRLSGGRGVILGARPEDEYLGAVLSRMETAPVDLSGETTVFEAGALLKRCRLLLTVDTGIMHLGAAAGVPLVALYGGAHSSSEHIPKLWRPWGDMHEILSGSLREGVPGALEAEEVIRGGKRILTKSGGGR
jgi:ADP-heptose:LPS heptosyltransferase